MYLDSSNGYDKRNDKEMQRMSKDKFTICCLNHDPRHNNLSASLATRVSTLADTLSPRVFYICAVQVAVAGIYIIEYAFKLFFRFYLFKIFHFRMKIT